MKMKKLPKDLVHSDYKFKIILIGDAAVGKTSFLLRFTENKFTEDHLATIGVDFQSKCLSFGKKIIKLQIWDTAGQERFRSITRSYYKNSHGCLAIYDISDESSFEKIKELIEYYKEESEARLPFNVILIGNKSDLDLDRHVPTLKGKMLAEEYGIPFFETSVKNDQNVDEAFMAVAGEAIKSTKYIDEKTTENVKKLHDTLMKPKKKSKCC
ncbi:unnamed protein product [Moneuplotes crassus]|uniref:Uncharacterized protein n=1 Tax=Euplotes crassus TaxID=5936 RepID=A0AAD2D4Q2_EUPCR|nr:unnamed protein product [Moneuplotes crassus]CAI2380420.1 unnamed protein product [Moneuplotes crassus]